MTDENAEAWADAGGPIDPEPEGGDDKTVPASESAPQEGAESQAEAEGKEGKEGEPKEGEDEQPETADEFAEPPEFWTAERKALWNKDLPLELRQAIHEHERESAKAINGKLMEAAEARKTAEANLQKFTQERDQLAQWWQQMGPQLQNAFRGKWDGIDWVRMATEDPALYAKTKAQFDAEKQVLDQAQERHQAEVVAANHRAQQALQQAKTAEHTKLATRHPDHFGEGKAQATYDALGKYLMERGFSAERIQSIYEADVIEIALESMLYRKAKAEAARATQPKPATATQTSRRVVPGARASGQPTKTDSMRQAEQRLRSGQDLSEDDVAQLFG